MSFWDELAKLKNVFVPWLAVWLVLTIFFFGFGIEKKVVFERLIYCPYPSLDSIAVFLLNSARESLLPQGVELVTLNPLNAFVVLMLISLVLAFIVSFPLFLYKLIRYLSPALYPAEKKAIFKVMAPSAILFLLGCLFSYLILVPLTFRALYTFADVIGVETFFYIAEFVPFVLGLTVAVGALFLLPVFMVLLTRFGIIDGKFWKDKWRYSMLFFLIFSAIITPDGTGISMMILALPLMGLYFLGTIMTAKNSKHQASNTK